MNRRKFISTTTAASAVVVATRRASRAKAQTTDSPEQVHPGIWKFTLGGVAEKFTPTKTRRVMPAVDGLKALPPIDSCPIAAAGFASERGFLVRLPLEVNEMVYGLGLQLQSFIQRGLKKKLRVNADPEIDSGDTHAPVPFYVTTRGYGVLVDTARYATFYCGNKRRKSDRRAEASAAAANSTALAQNSLLPAAYGRYRFNEKSEVIVEIPEAEGVDVYVFGGPTMRAAVQRYNLFSGGGALPPRWGLGVWYRCEKDFDQRAVVKLAAEFRERRIPCDVIGLEPGWQTHSYSCSFAWSDKFPDPAAMMRQLAGENFFVNLWEHAFTHPTSPIYQALLAHSGDYEVWDGLVPDFLTAEARKIFADFHEREHVARGVSGYKLDECDNSDFTRNWSFPEFSSFPSGADGEQMHSLFGLRYQDAIESVFEKRGVRTYGLVRSSQALAAPYPYALYSDLYDHAQFIRAVPKAGFAGLLWTPEVRHAASHEDLIRRLQSAVFSPVALVNAWYIKNPPWKQIDQRKNNAGEIDPDWEKIENLCRDIFNLRMRLVPYLHAAFVRYHREGLPPFRALVMDYPEDARTWTVDSQYLVGDGLMVAPLVAGETKRQIYLPPGDWFDFWDRTRHAGGRTITAEAVPLDRVPLFVKAGTLLPLAAAPAAHANDPANWQLSVTAYGEVAQAATLYEEDGAAAKPDLTEVRLVWDKTKRAGVVERSGAAGRRNQYQVAEWKIVG